MANETSFGVTIALAFIDREVDSASHYFPQKTAMAKWLAHRLGQPCEIHINTLNGPNASNESGHYLIATGLSAEHVDDGQIGRSNCISGLNTLSHSMSLEAAAGKNRVSHVGKIYNVLAAELANDLVSQITDIDEATVQLLSAIGQIVLARAASNTSFVPVSTISRRRPTSCRAENFACFEICQQGWKYSTRYEHVYR